MTQSLYNQWLAAKEAERKAIEERRVIEDSLLNSLKINEALDGTETIKEGGFTVKITGRLTKKVDAEMIQELAAEAGVTEHLGSLFRWTPEVNVKAWKAADETITAALAPAITIKPGRPSFSITLE
jgi:hypothetical protein